MVKIAVPPASAAVAALVARHDTELALLAAELRQAESGGKD